MSCNKIMGMGLGKIGDPSIIIKRKFRWTLEIGDPFTGGIIVPAQFVKIAARPNLSVEESELDFLNSKAWVPGKCNWEQVTATYYDMGSNDKEVQALYSWLAPQYSNIAPSPPPIQKADFFLKLYDGCGFCMEEWKMSDAFVTSLNFGELDHSSSECVTLEMTIRYQKVEYKSHCASFPGTEPPWGGIMASKEEPWEIPDEWII